jgi:predicted esterase
MEMISPHLPNTRIVIPNAPTRPITVNGGMEMPGWYDIVDMIGRHAPPTDSSSSSAKREDLDGIRASSDKLQELIAAERKLLGSNAGQVVLGGFSQGGAMSIYTGLRTTSPPLKSIMCCSGYVHDASSYESKELQGDLALDTPVWAFHGLAGTVCVVCVVWYLHIVCVCVCVCIMFIYVYHVLADEVVPYKWAEFGFNGVLKNAGVTIDLHTESTLGHSLSNPEVSAIVNHLKATLY